MEKLARAVTEAISPDSWDSGKPVGLQNAAEEWSTFALRNLRGKHLRRALAISEAIAQFAALFEQAE